MLTMFNQSLAISLRMNGVTFSLSLYRNSVQLMFALSFYHEIRSTLDGSKGFSRGRVTTSIEANQKVKNGR